MFRSHQGEGPYTGVRQIFVRLSGCPLRCVYCDTPESWTRSKTWSVGEQIYENPACVSEILSIIESWSKEEEFHSVSFTGGEPLLQPDFLAALAKGTQELGLKTYLDTSTILPAAFEKVAAHFDYFALDYKLPSTPGVRTHKEDFTRNLALAKGKRFVKIVTMANANLEEISEAARIIAREDRTIPLIIQIATQVNSDTQPPEEEFLLKARKRVENEGLTALVLPQQHILAGWK
mgnify:CR=1 FL=1